MTLRPRPWCRPHYTLVPDHKVIEVRNAARDSIGSVMPAKSLELQHTIRLIRELDSEIEDVENLRKKDPSDSEVSLPNQKIICDDLDPGRMRESGS